MIGIVMFVTALVLLLLGFPVAFTFGGVAVIFGLLAEGSNIFAMMPHRIWSIMNNTILMAIPLFIFMGIVLQKSKLAERLLESMGFLFGEIRGGIAISTVLVGALLAASTGVVGASVVAMGVISLPVMLKYNYDKKLATGAICAAGTLGQIIPPSIILIILGDVFQEPVGDLFKAAFWPGMTLVLFYVVVRLSQGPQAAIAPVTALWICAIPLLDTVAIMLRRMRKGRSPFVADREHLHHVFLLAGFTVRETVAIMAGLASLGAALGVWGDLAGVPDLAMFAGFLLLSALYYRVISRAWTVMRFLNRSISRRRRLVDRRGGRDRRRRHDPAEVTRLGRDRRSGNDRRREPDRRHEAPPRVQEAASPSAVRRERVQLPQNGSVTELMTPISPLPSR